MWGIFANSCVTCRSGCARSHLPPHERSNDRVNAHHRDYRARNSPQTCRSKAFSLPRLGCRGRRFPPRPRCTATRASTGLVMRLKRKRWMTQCGPSLTSAALPSTPRGTGLRSTWKLDALSGLLNALEATSGAQSLASARIGRRFKEPGKWSTTCLLYTSPSPRD